MLQTPSSRRKIDKNIISINLVPMLDALVTLIAFLLFTMSYLGIVSISSPVPSVSTTPLDEVIQKKPLQLTLNITQSYTQLWSPFDQIRPVKIKNDDSYQPDLKKIHQNLLQIKKNFPDELQIVLIPSQQVSYDTLVSVMDSARLIEATDAPIFKKNRKTGVSQEIKELFPNIVFGNLLGDT